MVSVLNLTPPTKAFASNLPKEAIQYQSNGYNARQRAYQLQSKHIRSPQNATQTNTMSS
jgi:hypothetical protein